MTTLQLARHLACGLMITFTAGIAHSAALTLSCTSSFHEDTPEAGRIAQKAKDIVTRKGSQLTIKLRARTIVMKNIASDDHTEVADYRFCDRKEGFILIAVLDGGDSSGTLIDEATGQISRAGVPTVLSHDRKLRFIQTHADGTDGEDWTLLRDGRVIWSGPDIVPAASPAEASAQLGSPGLNDKGQLTATARCTGDGAAPWPVVLETTGRRATWKPRRKCPG